MFNMKKFVFEEHTADIRIIATADSLTGLFDIALKALCNALRYDSDSFKTPDISVKAVIRSIDTSALLIDFLSEALSLMHHKKSVFCNALFDIFDDKYIECTFLGTMVDSFHEDVKAVTYTEAEIRQISGAYEVIFVLDI